MRVSPPSPFARCACRLGRIFLLGVALAFAVSAHSAAIEAGQVDDFEDGTTQGWKGGRRQANPNPPINVPSGGPDGGAFLLIESNGLPGRAGSNLIAFSTPFRFSQWAGNYNAAQVHQITVDLMNLGVTHLEVRLVMRGSIDFYATRSHPLPPTGTWERAVFSLEPEDLSCANTHSFPRPPNPEDPCPRQGPEEALARIHEIRLISNPSSVFVGETIVGFLGVDNMTAVPEIEVSEFQCYDAKRSKGSARFLPQDVHLEDQFWQTDMIAKKVKRLCAPVDVNEDSALNTEAHLTCYELKNPKGSKGSKKSKKSKGHKASKGPKGSAKWDPRDVLVTNIFGERQALTVKKPKSLCVPSTKEHADSGVLPGDASDLGVDHFLCYDVKQPKGAAGYDPLAVTLVDQFGEADRLLTKPKQLCTPVDKNSEGVLDAETHLVCYEVKKLNVEDPIRDLKLDVLVSNQFGYDQAYQVKKSKTVCLPSTKEVVDETDVWN